MPPVQLDLGLVLQGLMVLVLSGVGKAVWSASVAIERLGASFHGHEVLDQERHTAILRLVDRGIRDDVA